MEPWMTDLLVQLVSGAVGGTAAGSILKDLSLGKPGDAISGAVGGGIIGQILNSVLGGAGGGDVGGMDVAAVQDKEGASRSLGSKAAGDCPA